MEMLQQQSGDSLELTGNWDTLAKYMQEQFPLLTPNDLYYEAGKENELLTRLETRLYKRRDEVIVILRKWLAKIN